MSALDDDYELAPELEKYRPFYDAISAEPEEAMRDIMREQLGGMIRSEREVKKRKLELRDICICGHAISRHSKLSIGDGEYAMCQVHVADRTAQNTYGTSHCGCSGGVQIVARSEYIGPFTRRARGWHEPHALTAGMEVAAGQGEIEWLDYQCARCGTLGTGQTLRTMGVDDAGVPLRFSRDFRLTALGYPTKTDDEVAHLTQGPDTGKHGMFCAICIFELQTLYRAGMLGA